MVTITGSDFTGATSVKFGTTAAASFTVNSNTQITATTHAGSGIVDVHVTTAGGTSVASAADQYDFIAAPTITSVSPNVGPLGGGTSVLITGTNFNGATSVLFGASPAASFLVLSNTQISATNLAGTGIVAVSVTTPYGTSAGTTADQFTYIAPPTVTKVSPATGLTTGGTSVTITGTNLANATFVFFDTLVVPRTSFVSNSATQIVLKSPADPTVGPVDVTVTTVGGTSATSSGDLFTYEVTPSLQVSSQPASITAGQPITLQVQAFHQLDNLNTTFTKPVTVTLKIPTGGGASFGTPQATYSGGTVTLTGFTITKAATGYQLVLSSTGLTSTTTVSFDVTADADPAGGGDPAGQHHDHCPAAGRGGLAQGSVRQRRCRPGSRSRGRRADGFGHDGQHRPGALHQPAGYHRGHVSADLHQSAAQRQHGYRSLESVPGGHRPVQDSTGRLLRVMSSLPVPGSTRKERHRTGRTASRGEEQSARFNQFLTGN